MYQRQLDTSEYKSREGYLLGQRPQDELAFRDADMGDLEPVVVNFLIPVQQDVQINVAGSLVDDLVAAHGIFNRLKLVQQGQGLEVRLNLYRG